MRLCAHGCGQEATQFVKYKNQWICSKYAAQCPSVKERNAAGLKRAYEEGRRTVSNFTGNQGWAKGKTLVDISSVLTKNSSASTGLVRNIIQREGLLKYECAWCGLGPEWRGKPLTLELDHIDGDHRNHTITNLRFLCPNCHSMTPTYRGVNTGKKKVEDEQIIELIKEGLNNRQLLLRLNLTPRGGNYARVNKLRKTVQ